MRRGSALDNFHGAVVIAVVAVRVVQAAIDEKVDVVAVRHGFVAAAGAVHVARLVAGARGRAAFGVDIRHGDGMLLHAAFVRVVQMAFLSSRGAVPPRPHDAHDTGRRDGFGHRPQLRETHCLQPFVASC